MKKPGICLEDGCLGFARACVLPMFCGQNFGQFSPCCSLLGIESDSALAIKLINGVCSDRHPYAAIVFQIKAWKDKDWEVKFVHVYREANRVADCLANMARSLPLGVHVLRDPPASCRDLLFSD